MILKDVTTLVESDPLARGSEKQNVRPTDAGELPYLGHRSNQVNHYDQSGIQGNSMWTRTGFM